MNSPEVRVFLSLRFAVVLLLLAGAALVPVWAKDAATYTDGPFLIRVQRASRDDLSKLLADRFPVVMEMRECLLIEGTRDHLRRLDDQGRTSTVLDRHASLSDYLVVGLRPDSSIEALSSAGAVLHREENWVLLRVARDASLGPLASESVFVTRVPHESLKMPKGVDRETSTDAVDSTPPDPLVQAIADQVDPAEIDRVLSDVTSNPPTGTRSSTSQGCLDATVYCNDLYAELGLAVEYHNWNPSHAPNVIATQPGALNPDDIYMFIAHLDDLPSSGLAPGADDNASGSVAVLEAARAMSCYAFKNTVKYLNATGEELGLLGADAYADDAFARGDNILGVINLDMPGWEGNGSPDPEDLDINYNTTSEWLGLLFAECAQKYSTGLTVDAFYCPSLSASDHYPFWQNGWSAIAGITDNEGYCGHGGNYPYYHTSNDTVANLGDLTFYYAAVRTATATLAELAGPFKIITDRSSYACGSGIGLLVGDRDLDADSGAQETVTVEAWSDTEPTPESITLDERAVSSMFFEGVVPTTLDSAVPGNGVVSVTPGDTMSFRYVDSLDCDGATAVPYTATAAIDCTAPTISNVQVGGITGAEATISWDTDEPADSLVSYGELTPGSWTATETLTTAHGVDLRGLDECTVYVYSVSSADDAGNATTDDNQGQLYEFATGVNNQPEFDSTDTPIPIIDNTTFNSTVTVVDDETVLDVDVRVNITHTYDGDVDIYLIGPDGTRVELTTDNGGSGNGFTDTIFDDEAVNTVTGGAAPFTGRFQPEGSLASLDNLSAAGTWTLEVSDDAGSDQGQLLDWTLILTFPARQCGPVAGLVSHQLEVDGCSTGSAGLGNDRWDPGEQIEFSVTVENDGTGPVTAAIARVTPITAGVVMLDDTATVGDLAPGVSSDTLPPHIIAQLPDTLACGQTVEFQVDMISNEGSWPEPFQQMIGEVIAEQSGVALSEGFFTGIPATWTIIDSSMNGTADGFTWYSDNLIDPAGCGSANPAPPIVGPWVTVDSSCTGGGDRMDEQLITPLMDFVNVPTVTLEFDHWFAASEVEVAAVDVRSAATGGSWVNVATWSGTSTTNPQHEVIDVSAQAGNAPDVEIRWHYSNAQHELYWYVDNVVVHFSAPETCLYVSCAAPSTSPPPVPDGSGVGSPMLADRAIPDGSEISITWDDQCAPPAAKILYGPLDQVSAYVTSGAVCDIANQELWMAVPAGDLWFVVIGDDAAGVESSWGLATEGERNGLVPSNTCGAAAKEITGTCP